MRESLVEAIAELAKSFDKKNCPSTAIIAIDMIGNQPGDLVIHFQGAPYETLGMIEHMMSILKEHKKLAQKSLDEHFGNSKGSAVVKNKSKIDIEKMINLLPEELKLKVIDIQKRMEKAFEEGNVAEMINLKNEIANIRQEYNNIDNIDLNKSENDKTNDDDINEFK